MLKQLQEKNTKKIKSLNSESFVKYGRILTGFDTTQIIKYMEEQTQIPEAGNIYVASVEEMEKFSLYSQLKNSVYGGMDIQFGFCNGKNTTYNGCEYHKGSEITIAVTDFMIIFGDVNDICDNEYDNSKAEIFYVEKGTVFEIYQTTLHLSPCCVREEGFKSVIILPKGTNTPLEFEKTNTIKEEKIMLMKNKWILAHKDREPLVKAGAYTGIIGENFSLNY